MDKKSVAALVVVVGIVLFGVAIAIRSDFNPWWTNGGVAVLVLVTSAAVLRTRLRSLFSCTWSQVAWAAVVGAAMVALTHLSYRLATRLLPGLDETVAALYLDIGRQSPGAIGSIALIIVVAAAEEALWRGLAVELCFPRLGRVRTGLIVVLLYTIPQLIGGDWVLVAAAIGAGTVFTVQRLITGGLVAPITTHAIWSACIFSALPLST